MQNSILIHNVSTDELCEQIRKAVREELLAQKTSAENTTEKFLTRQETATLLRITLPTLNSYSKKGILVGIRIGFRVLYREDQVKKALREIPLRR